jgi:hypothetical protein
VSLKSHLARSRFAVDEPALIGSLNVSLLALHKLNLYSVAIAHLIGSAAAATCCEPPLRWHVSRRVAAEPPPVMGSSPETHCSGSFFVFEAGGGSSLGLVLI